MGRSFESVRQGVKEVSVRWLKVSRALKKEDQVYGQKLVDMAKKHSREALYALDDPLEAAVFLGTVGDDEGDGQGRLKNNKNGIESASFHDPDLFSVNPVKLVD